MQEYYLQCRRILYQPSRLWLVFFFETSLVGYRGESPQSYSRTSENIILRSNDTLFYMERMHQL